MANKQLNFYLWISSLLILPFLSYGQDSTSIKINEPTPQDTTSRFAFIKNFLKKENGFPNPKASLTLSLIVPGAGQTYNGKWWKTPIIYGTLGGIAYGINFQSKNYIIYREAYKRKRQGLPHFLTGTRLDDASLLKSRRDKYDKNRQLLYVGMVVAWFANGVEAFTDAHLMNFDVSDDLSLHIQPSFQAINHQDKYSGIGLVFVFK